MVDSKHYIKINHQGNLTFINYKLGELILF